MSVPDPALGSNHGAQSQPVENAITRQAVLEQLNRILSSPLFTHSKRSGPLLKYLVHETLEGRASQIKERVIGVAVFGREPTYDTNEDPIVRRSAVELRKRIAQYYHDPARESELNIDLTSGSYVPKFRAPTALRPAGLADPREHAVAANGASRVAPVPAANISEVESSSPRRQTLGYVWTIGAIGVIAAAGAIVFSLWRTNPLDAFWAPLLTAKTVTLFMGGTPEIEPSPGTTPAASPEPTVYQAVLADRVGFADALTLARAAAQLSRKGVRLEVRRGGSVTLSDLRKAPAVLVGALNNPWAARLEDHLRYRFLFDAEHRVTYLIDQQAPSRPLWVMDSNAPYSQMKEDRAIISRFVDERTEQSVLILAGFGRDGTTAAGEFVTEEKYLRVLAEQAPRGWSRKNLQVVIATDLVDGHSGPPRVVATHFW